MTAYRASRLKGLLASGLCAVTVAFGWTPVSADGQLGLRLFPSTLAIDDPFVADEIGIGVVHLKTPAGAQPSPTLTTGFEARYSKRISEALGLTLGGRLLRLDPDTGGSRTGVDNPDIELKYEIVESARHEALLSAALGWEIGGVGDRDVGAASFDIVLPTVFFAKGFGDLPESLPFLRPFALTGRVGALIPTREQSRVFTSSGVGTLQRNPDVIESGLVIEYSLPYWGSSETWGCPRCSIS
jgi:hypothetical protein